MFAALPAALILFVIASVFKISFIYNVSYLLFGVYFLATFWSQRTMKDLRVTRAYQERALLGDIVEVTLEIENRSVLPIPWLFFHDRLPLSLISPPFFRRLISLDPHEKRVFHYQLHCRQRGWYQIGPLTAGLGDVFGLSGRQQDYAAGVHLTVYPKILPLDELGFPSKSPFGDLRTRQLLYEDPSRVVGVREYQSGDSLRKINWKVSASSGRLQVRKLEPAMTLETVVLLNVNRSEYDRQHAYAGAEQGIVVAASLVSHLAGLRQEIGLLTNGIDPVAPEAAGLAGYLPGKGRAHLVSILELLGRLMVVDDRSFWSEARTEFRRLPWGATLVVVTPRETDELLETVVPLRRSGFNVVLVYLDYPNPVAWEPAQRRAATLGMTAFRIWRDEDAEVWRQPARGSLT
ncbi:MAG TPA: DUF58 domain-containing protein [Chloroflexota bacterium]|nr:DUF58 domain-containing protein [Chloroflexota bacterium]